MRISSICILLGLLLGSCGGGGGDGGGFDRTVAVASEANLDGYLFEDGGGGWHWEPGYLRPSTGEWYREGAYEESRQFFTFDLGVIPAGASILQATLRLYQYEVVGDPYGTLGDVVVDHVFFDQVIRLAYFDGQTRNRNIGTVSTEASLGYRDVIVTSAVRIDHDAGRERSQFRVRFDVPLFTVIDGRSDFVCFTDTDGAAGDTMHPPMLLVEFRVP